MSQRTRNLLQIHGAVMLFGLPGLFGKLLALSPLVIVFGRVGLASLALLVAVVVCGVPLWPRSRRSLLAFLALGILLAVHSGRGRQTVGRPAAPPATWRSTRCGGSEPTPRHCRAWQPVRRHGMPYTGRGRSA